MKRDGEMILLLGLLLLAAGVGFGGGVALTGPWAEAFGDWKRVYRAVGNVVERAKRELAQVERVEKLGGEVLGFAFQSWLLGFDPLNLWDSTTQTFQSVEESPAGSVDEGER